MQWLIQWKQITQNIFNIFVDLEFYKKIKMSRILFMVV